MKNKIPLIIALILIIFSTYLFFKLFEPYEEMSDLGWDKKALRNPYLAAEQFLLQNKIKVTSSNNFEKISGLTKHGMIFISDSRKILTKKRVSSILDWLDKGGHLIITAPIYNKNKPGFLFSKFKVKNSLRTKKDKTLSDSKKPKKKLSEQLTEKNKELKTKRKKKDRILENKNIIPEDDITYLSFTDIEKKLKVNFSSDSSLYHPYLYSEDDYKKTKSDPTYWAGNEYGTYFMQFSVGSGLLSIITDNEIWRSYNIDTLDHAYFLWVLSEANSDVVLLYGANVPTIFDYMWDYTSELIITFFLWLFAWLVYRGRRFGKIRDNFSIESRSISEHIRASAKFMWRNKKHVQLIEPVRTDIFKRVNRLYSSFDNLNQSEQMKLISNHSNLELKKVEIALVKSFNGNENEFTRVIKSLQKIRNSL